MDASDAREHLEMIERIIAASSQKLEAGGEFFVIWGVAGAALDVLSTLVYTGHLPTAALWGNAAILIVAVTLSIIRGRAYRKNLGRLSLLQREYFNVLWLAIALGFVTNLIGFNLFSFTGELAIWNVLEALVLLYIGIHGNRRAQIAGIFMVVTVGLANFVLPYSGYVLAAGPLFAYAGFGAAELLARD